MKRNICTLEKLMLLTLKNQTNLLHLRMMNGLSNSHVAKIEKPLNNVSVEIVVLQTNSLQTVLPTNAIDVQNWVIFLLNALDKPQDVLLALLARTLIIYIKTVQTMSAEDAVHWDTLKPTAPSLPGKDKTWFINVDVLLIKLIVIVCLPIVLAVPTTVANVKFLTDLKFSNFLKKNLFVQDVIQTITAL